MARCRFCGKQFGTAQGVRGHLRACPSYRSGQVKPDEVKARQPIQAQVKPRRPQVQGSGFDPVAHMRAQAELAEWKLKLRQLKAVDEDLDEKESARHLRKRLETEAARRREQEQAQAHLQAELEAEEREQRKAEAESRRQERRHRIARAKDAADRGFVPGTLVEVPLEVRAAIKREIEHELSALPALEELSQGEVDELAEGIAARHHRPLVEEDRSRREKERQQREAEAEAARQRAERERQEQKKKWEALNEQLERDEQKEKLVRYGSDFASEELDEMHIRPSLERYAISEKVKERLRERLTGQETKAEIEDMVEEILEESVEKP